MTERAASTLSIYADTRGRGLCRSCGASIEWAELTTGKRMPFDAPIVALRTSHDESRRLIEHVEPTTHFATCPDADRWRRNKR